MFWISSKLFCITFCLGISIVLGPFNPTNMAWAQIEEVDEMKLIEQIAQLQKELESEEIPKRVAAEKAIIDLGVPALDHLEQPTDKTPSDAVERITRIRIALETLAVKQVTQPSKLSLSGAMSLADTLKSITKQTGNVVAVEGATDAVMEQELKFEIKDGTFWQAINSLTKQTGFTSNPYESDKGILRLMPANITDAQKAEPAPYDASGIFETTVVQVSASKNLLKPNLDYCNVRIRLRWEPRISPISIDMPASSIKVIDEFDQVIKVSNAEAVFSGTVNSDVPELEFSIPLQSIDRQVERLKSITAELKTILPGRIETFKFQNVGRLEKGTVQSKAGVTVGFEGINKNEDLFGVLVSIAFDDPKKGLESHLSWVFENEMKLVGDDGKESFPLATETYGRTKEKITIMYFFADDPAALSLSYKTPAAIVSVPVKIILKGIPLP